jgi:methionine synthase II (cobalamin-independent)
VSTPYWTPGIATGIGSLPGIDSLEAARTVAGELPGLPHLPELPARGVGADLIGRTAALLVDLATEVVPSGYRVTARAGREHRRGVDLLRADLDALEEALDATQPAWVKVQAAGPWTLAANVEMRNGHRVLTDRGALREFAASLAEGLVAHVAEVAARTGARVTVQLDEPSLPAVLAGALPTPSGFGTVASVPEPDAQQLLRSVIEALPEPVIVHCCAPKAPIGLLSGAGALALALDVAMIGTHTAALDTVGEIWDAGIPVLLGLVPSRRGDGPEPDLRSLARPALDLVDRVGFARERLAELIVPTPTCGLAGASPDWARKAMALAVDLGKAFVDPPTSWSTKA